MTYFSTSCESVLSAALHIKCADRTEPNESLSSPSPSQSQVTDVAHPFDRSIDRSDVFPLPDSHSIVVVVVRRTLFLRFRLSRVTFCRFNVSFRPSFRSSFLSSAASAAAEEAAELRRRRALPSMHTCAYSADIGPERGRPGRRRAPRHRLPLSCRKCVQNKGVICPLFTARELMAFGEVPVAPTP